MIPADLSRSVVRALRRAVEDGELPAGVVVPERVVVERTRPGGVGDYASPVAFGVGKGAGVAPRTVAEVLAPRLARLPGIERVEVTGAGFLNFVLAASPVGELVRGIRACAEKEERRRGEERYGYGFVSGAPRPADLPAPAPARREDLVRLAVLRIGLSQGRPADIGLDAPVAPVPPAPPIAPVPKRDGDVAALYGPDAAAWAMLCVPGHETPVFPAWLLVQDESSEFFRVRYAHARSRALTRNAGQLGFQGEPGDVDGGAAGVLVRALVDHPLVLEAAAHHRAPERLVRQLVVLADALLDFQYGVLPKGDEKPSAAHRARLALAEAAGTVLAGGLALLGIDAPDHL
ncbi:DALR anticodon-binding domain-containing protein [Streptomyces sp. H27-H1]|uniref:ArgS-related anticodon-binding protein NrtL n=1 Tax=Streptomyces sp. H27-H1 TaxID=2996461 RepID=UPI00227213F9|nr:DALR anticodon-binding domain-containing protein [Streptomyces sp. H27-H1]MCY0927576.1 DALR anticodon-binding domain-containing protein [Streptomyces sp. H27-H1]